MSDKHKSTRLVSPYGKPKHTEPHSGHGGTSFEGADAAPSLVIGSLAIIGGTLLITFAVTIGIQKLLQDRNPPGELPSPLAPARVIPRDRPLLQVHPWEELPDMRAHEDQILDSYGKDSDGHLRIPINQAMDAVVTRLNVAPGAAQGIVTPGGEGRDFSTSINAMPPAYQRPQITGEIRKNAQR